MEYDIIDLIKLVGSVGLFIYGMKIMSEGIQKIAGSSLRSFLSYITNNKYLGAFSGFLITAVIQSSSAATVMIVSFVNAGLLTLQQSVGVIMGANIGTTVTGWFINGLGFANISIAAFALPAIGLGVPLLYSGTTKAKSWGEFLTGFGILFLGLEHMKGSIPIIENFDVNFLSHLQAYTQQWFSIPLFILLGAVLTIILQSSSTALGITLVIVAQGWMPINAAIGLILGENIGTTTTAYLASLVGNVSAKRAARIHFIFNVFGVVWAVAVFPFFVDFIDYLNINILGSKYSITSANLYHRGLAMTGAVTLFHTVFNIVNTLLLIHFIPLLINLSKRWVPSETEVEEMGNISVSNYIDTPEMAILQGQKYLLNMGQIGFDIYKNYRDLRFDKKDLNFKWIAEVEQFERKADDLQLKISSFLINVSYSNSSETTSNTVINMLSMANDLERICDTCYQLCLVEKKRQTDGVEFKPVMKKEITPLIMAVEDALVILIKNLGKSYQEVELGDAVSAEKKINELRDSIRKRHLERLEKKEDQIQSGLYFRDTYHLLEKIGDHILRVNGSIVGRH